MDKADPQEATWMNLSSFPETILAHIGDFLTFGDRRNLFTTCRTLRENSSSLSQLLAVATVASPRDAEVFRRFFQDHAVNIIHFDLGAFASDTFLQGMSGIAGNDPSLAAHVLDDSRLPTRMPNLRSVAMVGAQQVTDRGLIYLALGGPRTQSPPYRHHILSPNNVRGDFLCKRAAPSPRRIKAPTAVDGWEFRNTL